MNDAKSPWIDWHYARAHPVQAALGLAMLIGMVCVAVVVLYGFVQLIAEGRLLDAASATLTRLVEAFFVGQAWWVGWAFVGLLAFCVVSWAVAWIITVLRLPFLMAEYFQSGTAFYRKRAEYYDSKRRINDRVP